MKMGKQKGKRKISPLMRIRGTINSGTATIKIYEEAQKSLERLGKKIKKL